MGGSAPEGSITGLKKKYACQIKPFPFPTIRGMLNCTHSFPCQADESKAALLERMTSNNTASYKFFWLKALITLIEQGRAEASFLEAGALMTAHAWDPVIFFKLSLGAADKLGRAIRLAQSELRLDDYTRFEQAAEAISRGGNEKVAFAAQDLTRYVRRRFLAPCFAELLQGVSQSRIDAAISRASLVRPEAGPYWIDEKAKAIRLNPDWAAFILGNLPLVKSWLDFKLARYLQARNPCAPAIVCKLTRPEARNLAEPRKFWSEAIRRGGVREIYSGLPFTEENFGRYGSLSIDHFVPWRYVLHDEFWNLTPMFKNLNSAKGDRLPDLDRDLKPLCQQAFQALRAQKGTSLGNEAMRSFLNIDPEAASQVEDGGARGEACFSESLKRVVVQAYEGTAFQGFSKWMNRPEAAFNDRRP